MKERVDDATILKYKMDPSYYCERLSSTIPFPLLRIGSV